MGLQHVNFGPDDGLCLPFDQKILPEKLGDLGYATHAVGKWHLGFAKKSCMPTNRGFDSFFGKSCSASSVSHITYSLKIHDVIDFNRVTSEWEAEASWSLGPTGPPLPSHPKFCRGCDEIQSEKAFDTLYLAS